MMLKPFRSPRSQCHHFDGRYQWNHKATITKRVRIYPKPDPAGRNPRICPGYRINTPVYHLDKPTHQSSDLGHPMVHVHQSQLACLATKPGSNPESGCRKMGPVVGRRVLFHRPDEFGDDVRATVWHIFAMCHVGHASQACSCAQAMVLRAHVVLADYKLQPCVFLEPTGIGHYG